MANKQSGRPKLTVKKVSKTIRVEESVLSQIEKLGIDFSAFALSAIVEKLQSVTK